MNKIKKSMIASAALIVFSLLMIFYAIPTQISSSSVLGGSTSAVDSRFFPYLTCIFIGGIAAIELIVAILQYVKEKKAAEANTVAAAEPATSDLKAWIVFALFVLYAIAFNQFGFIISSAIFPPIVLFVLGSRKWQHYVAYYVVAALTYVLFVYALNVSLN